MRLGVTPTTTNHTDFYNQRFWSFITLGWKSGLCGLCCSLVVPSSLSACKCGTAQSSSGLAACPLHEDCPSLPLLLVWMNVSLTPWLLNFDTVLLSGSCAYFLFLNLLSSFFWLCEEAKCIYLHLHLDQKSSIINFKMQPTIIVFGEVRIRKTCYLPECSFPQPLKLNIYIYIPCVINIFMSRKDKWLKKLPRQQPLSNITCT